MADGPILLVILALSIAFIIIFTAKFKVHAFLVWLLAALGVGSSRGWGQTIAVTSMGVGPMIVSHANDSYFWVVSKFFDLDASITFKAYTSVPVLIGLTTDHSHL